jgi:hypothetical protein
LFCFIVTLLFWGDHENDIDGKEKRIESGKPPGVILPLSSFDGIKPISRRF